MTCALPHALCAMLFAPCALSFGLLFVFGFYYIDVRGSVARDTSVAVRLPYFFNLLHLFVVLMGKDLSNNIDVAFRLHNNNIPYSSLNFMEVPIRPLNFLSAFLFERIYY